MMKNIGLALFVFLFALGCGEEEDDPPQDTTNSNDTVTPFVSFAEAGPVLIANCGGCHTTESKGLWNASDYDSLMQDSYFCDGKTKAECCIVRIEDGSMSTAKNKTVSSAALQLLKDWVASGLPE